MKKLVLFDFDGTITKKDTFRIFLGFTHRGFLYYWNILLCLPCVFFYFTGIINEKKLKEYILKRFFQGKSKKQLFGTGALFIEHLIKTGIIKKSFIQLIEHYKNNDAVIAIVSASPDIWINPFCERFNLHCICTQLEFSDDGIFKGQFSGRNCKGIEKKIRVLEQFVPDRFDKVIVYGNSPDDKELASLANQIYWITNKQDNPE